MTNINVFTLAIVLSTIFGVGSPETALAQSSESNPTPAAVPSESDAKVDEKTDSEKANAAKNWKPLEGSWVVCQFGGDGEVEIKGNSAKIGYGDPLSGIRWEGDVLRENYEIALEARRTEGYDFFCGLTFPVGESKVSLIMGGWGGGILGISNVDDNDASQNATTQFRNFDNDTWYKVRARVTDKAIECWIDGKKLIDQSREGHVFDIRAEMEQCEPLGVAAFQCDSEIRNMRVRRLTAEDLASENQDESDKAASNADTAKKNTAKKNDVKQKESK
ncbi:signal peptide protein [Rhodopirellula maiorica SM1]|uniref:Signal peptide protein n=1 Tax=Rhodopirellula maiorica SM1 TaxID=1265738 RepID=M5RQM7_9BACT|nr:family 16 glycoside hydrolase [Rhodopirellula maiorica]EMI17687.1 signal peptide protein [Rhodopirellula maiorica SM1]